MEFKILLKWDYVRQVSKSNIDCRLYYCSNSTAQSLKKSKYIVNGYVGSFRGLVDAEAIKAEKMTHKTMLL